MNNRQCSLTVIKLASRNIHDFMKGLSRNIYFGTEFNKSLCCKSLELYSSKTCAANNQDFYIKIVHKI